MTLKKTIKNADLLRPNVFSSELKAEWVYRLEDKVRMIIGVEPPERNYPEDTELLCPLPYDNVYELYIVAMIDYYHGESDTYTNDMTMFNTAWNEAIAYLRRTHRPKSKGGFII